MIDKAAGRDPVWKAGVVKRVTQLRKELLGPAPSAVEDILVRRVVNAWVAVHAIEIDQSARPSADHKQAIHLDRSPSRAQSRLIEASRALAAVRRLPAPRVVQQNVVTTGQVNVLAEG